MIVSLLLFGWGNARAQIDISQWLNPGPLAQPHAELEGVKNCTLCHATAKGVPDEKCLECHKEIAQGLQKRVGFHARQTKECRVCHPDHKGRAYDMRDLSRLKFDHDDTGYPLTGGHKKPKCEECHKEMRKDCRTGKPTARRTYLGAPVDCVACHPDIHKSGKKDFERCAACHTVDLWRPARTRMQFDHDRESRYPLTGKHGSVTCYKCHKQKTWAPLPFAKCQDCHADVHKGKFGPKCEMCHVTKDWKTVLPPQMAGKVFDHDKTPFPLTGAHREVTCVRCHGPVIGKMKGFEQCGGCHNNPHGEEFNRLWSKKTCKECHLTDGWNILSFQHNRDSRWNLEGKHLKVPCRQCHGDARYRWLESSPDCSACHSDAHRKQFEKPCVACHVPAGFNRLLFNHDRDSPFPLAGKHKQVPCGKCHEEGRYKPIKRMCQDCHNDFHNKELGIECARCHSPAAFNSIEFDHNREARFKLEGRHAAVPCNQCHKEYKYKLGVFDCAGCHSDPHGNQFGRACERCHTPESFSARGGFHDFGEFSLGGVHDALDCLACHGPTSAVRARPLQCTSCHADPHMNSLGPACQDCHGQRSWLPPTFRHAQTGFELSGAHRFLSCDRCHFNRIFGGLPQECSFCHAKDFRPPPAVPRHPAALEDCTGCHFSFGWRPAR